MTGIEHHAVLHRKRAYHEYGLFKALGPSCKHQERQDSLKTKNKTVSLIFWYALKGMSQGSMLDLLVEYLLCLYTRRDLCSGSNHYVEKRSESRFDICGALRKHQSFESWDMNLIEVAGKL